MNSLWRRFLLLSLPFLLLLVSPVESLRFSVKGFFNALRKKLPSWSKHSATTSPRPPVDPSTPFEIDSKGLSYTSPTIPVLFLIRMSENGTREMKWIIDLQEERQQELIDRIIARQEAYEKTMQAKASLVSSPKVLPAKPNSSLNPNPPFRQSDSPQPNAPPEGNSLPKPNTVPREKEEAQMSRWPEWLLLFL